MCAEVSRDQFLGSRGSQLGTNTQSWIRLLVWMSQLFREAFGLEKTFKIMAS